jgi:hypothetical protein
MLHTYSHSHCRPRLAGKDDRQVRPVVSTSCTSTAPYYESSGGLFLMKLSFVQCAHDLHCPKEFTFRKKELASATLELLEHPSTVPLLCRFF